MVKEKIIKIRCYTLNYKIHKKISLGEYSSLRKKKKKDHFNLGNLEKNTWGLKHKNGE